MSLSYTVEPRNFQQRIQKQPPQEKAEEKAPIIDLLLLPPGEAAGTYEPKNHERVLAIGIRKDASKEDAHKARTILTEPLFNISSAHEFRTNAPWPGKNKERYQERFYCVTDGTPTPLWNLLTTLKDHQLLNQIQFTLLVDSLIPRSAIPDTSFRKYAKPRGESFTHGAGI